MTFQIEKATKTAAKGRIAIEGPAGSGKTYTSLILATVLAEEGRIIFIDSEKRSSEKYADIFDFDILPLEPPYTVKKYTEAIRFASELDGYDVVIVDSLSHAWAGEGGALEQVDTAKSKYQGNT
jgi:KaiC/GvpD/RAD55 family RecA-like ATPase